MVTAVLIPIVIGYFYWRTRKEVRIQESNWMEIGNIPKESVLSGEIEHVHTEKQRFYYSRYIYVQEIRLKTEAQSVTVKKRTPLTKDTLLETFTAGDRIRVYGNWQGKDFYFNEYELLHNKW